MKKVVHTESGTISDSECIVDGYSFMSGNAIKNNVVYPLIRVDNTLGIYNLRSKNVTAINGQDVLTYDTIGDCDVTLYFMKL